MQQKLKINEYIFEIKQNDIRNAYLEYSFEKIQCSNFKDGKKISLPKIIDGFLQKLKKA